MVSKVGVCSSEVYDSEQHEQVWAGIVAWSSRCYSRSPRLVFLTRNVRLRSYTLLLLFGTYFAQWLV
ncbi:hypothetical protein Y032_0009g465 [Ancylostoma ceylanicum]|uniref:Uncharacterized protein n=1 Tax=Ancylostoma ceylanicum TaxID=53326 RepID=A0A016VJR8_9BILA|nr:hypothetical protein Y032_0009g465 [Ancylostoma ceylanicum]